MNLAIGSTGLHKLLKQNFSVHMRDTAEIGWKNGNQTNWTQINWEQYKTISFNLHMTTLSNSSYGFLFTLLEGESCFAHMTRCNFHATLGVEISVKGWNHGGLVAMKGTSKFSMELVVIDALFRHIFKNSSYCNFCTYQLILQQAKQLLSNIICFFFGNFTTSQRNDS